ncbi:MAG TPA: TRAP transporter substrate-binding protein [Acetobacteraceae bacterium]|jgi:TRAP-type C4-dicarboxylate transport system substrate-binding protein|nr:TRAP transporter substrate-binding protein [Acetobacteraceae bacterium]
MRLAMSAWLVLLATNSFLASAEAQQPITLTLSHFLGPNSFFQVDFAQPWARELETRTGGKVKVEIYNAASPFGEVTKQATQVKDGSIDIALGLRGAEGDRFPRSSIVELPFVVRDAQSGSRALWLLYKDGVLGNEFQDYKVLALFVQNPGLIHTATKRIVGPADLKGVRLRAPNKTVAVALESIGAVPEVLQVNDVMPAVQAGRIDGIVTNWGNPLPGFNDYMKFHTDIAFYTSVFFVVMNKQKFAALPTDIRSAIDDLSNDALVARFGRLWNEWDEPVRDGASGPGQEIIVPGAGVLAQWHDALRPATERYLDGLIAGGFTDARTAYARLLGAP